MDARIFQKKRRGVGWVFTLTLIAALLITGTAFAEGEEPPPAEPALAEEEAPATEEPASPAPEEPTPVEEPAAEETVEEEAEAVPQEETPPVETADAPVVEEPAAKTDEPAAAEESDADIVEAAAETGVELTDESGETLDMASQESAELLASADPYFKVGIRTYRFFDADGVCDTQYPGDPYCFQNQGSDVIQDALDYMTDNSILPSDRKLYVEGGSYEGFTINGAASPQMALLNGVIGVDGADNTDITSDISITFNTGGFTLSGLSVNGGITVTDSIGTLKLEDLEVYGSSASGINVQNHKGTINIERVSAYSNNDSGIYLDNTAGTNPITIKNSSFKNNGVGSVYHGLEIKTNSKATLEGVAASDNNGDGIHIRASSASIKNVYVFDNDSGASYDDAGYGLYIDITGSGTTVLEHVYAGENDEGGFYIEGGSVRAKYVEANGSPNGVGLYFWSDVGSSRIEYGCFNGNGFDGIYIENNGSIYLYSIQSNGNGRAGTYLDNTSGSGSVTVTSPGRDDYLHANSFNDNISSGLEILSNGSVSLYNFDAQNNGNTGVLVDNSSGKGSVTVKKTLRDWNNFVGNNLFYGMDITSGGTVNIFDSLFMDNLDTGLAVDTVKPIGLTRVEASNNLSFGAVLENDMATSAYGVTLNDCAFNGNGNTGILVESMGSISTKGFTASGNSQKSINLGASLGNSASVENLLWEPWMEDTYVFYGTMVETVVLDTESYFFDSVIDVYDSSDTLLATSDSGWDEHLDFTPPANDYYYVRVHVKNYEQDWGRYTFAMNDSGHSNYLEYGVSGAILNNSAGKAGINITHGSKTFQGQYGGNYFDYNTDDGLSAESFGTISINGAAARSNFQNGLDLNNPYSTASVTVQNTRKNDFWSGFDSNDANGLYITTMGNITMQNVSASNNDSTGAWLDNCLWDSDDCSGFGSVRVLAYSSMHNNFNDNGGHGLSIQSHGAVKLVNITADNNGYDGVAVVNEIGSATAGVTLSTSGRYMMNSFSTNGDDGLVIWSLGNILLKNLDASSNGALGAEIHNFNSATPRPVSITSGYFGSNGESGIQINSLGNITWKYGGAWNNQNHGAELDNSWPDGTGNITVGGSGKEGMWFGDNGQDGSGSGLLAYSSGSVSVSYADARNNRGSGIFLDNTNADTDKPVTISDVHLENNSAGPGLRVITEGHITVKGIYSSGNSSYGAWLANKTGSGNVTVTTTGRTPENSFDSNGDTGLEIETAGKVYIRNSGAQSNSGHGIFVDNRDGTGSVTYKTTNRSYGLSDNGISGMYILSNGAVTVSNTYYLHAGYNSGGSGVTIFNNTAPIPQNVSISRVSADNNGMQGTFVMTNGKISASYLSGFENGSDGAALNSNLDGIVTLSGSSQFDNNGTYGLQINAHNNVTVSGVTSQHNAEHGLYINADDGKISVKNSMLRGNGYNGAHLVTDGDFYLDKLQAFSNGRNAGFPDDSGVYIFAGMDSNVEFRYSYIQANFGGGILIYHDNPAFDWDLASPYTAPYLKLVKTYYYGNGGTDLAVLFY